MKCAAIICSSPSKTVATIFLHGPSLIHLHGVGYVAQYAMGDTIHCCVINKYCPDCLRLHAPLFL